MTDAEARLWYHLRSHELGGYKFRRQHPLEPFILDFYCAQAKLVIEVDGGQHFDETYLRQDERRTGYLEQQGLRVLRFTNSEVLSETESVLNAILGSLNPSP
jgi:very-short-patch-repair endonuclease